MTAGDPPSGEDAMPGAPAAPAGRALGPPPDKNAGSPPGPPAEQAGRAPAVRPFLVTAGRVAGTGSGPPMPLETQVVATAGALEELDRLTFERHDIVALCRRPQSLAEVAARLRLHLNVVRVLAQDLEASGHLTIYVPRPEAAHDLSVLRRVIDGLRAIPDSRETTP